MTLAHRIPAASMPSHMNYAPDSSIVYVSLQGSNALMAISTASGQVLWKKPVGETPAGVLWLNGQLLVGDMGTDIVSVVDPTDGSVVRKIKTGRGAHNLFISPDGRELYVCNRVEGTISVLDPKTLTVQRSIPLPGGPDDMDFAPDGKIWVSRRFAHSVAVLDPRQRAVHHHRGRTVAARHLAEPARAGDRPGLDEVGAGDGERR